MLVRMFTSLSNSRSLRSDKARQYSGLHPVQCQKQAKITCRGEKKSVKDCHQSGEMQESCEPRRKPGGGNENSPPGIIWRVGKCGCKYEYVANDYISDTWRLFTSAWITLAPFTPVFGPFSGVSPT